MGLSTTAKNQVLNAIDASGTPTNLATHLQLHSADPGTTGANELGSTSRQACAWNAASGGTKTNSGAPTFTTPGTVPATHFCTHSAGSGGTPGIAGALTSSVQAVTITVAAGALSMSAA